MTLIDTLPTTVYVSFFLEGHNSMLHHLFFMQTKVKYIKNIGF